MTVTRPTQAELEERRCRLGAQCNRATGHALFESCDRARRVVLVQLMSYRPLSVYELMNVGLGLTDAIDIAVATGARTD